MHCHETMNRTHTDLHLDQEMRRSRFLLIAGIARIIAWTILAVLIGLGLIGVPGFHWSKIVASSIPFVVLISVYANWATDLDQATAAYAALIAARAHHDADRLHDVIDQ